MNVTPTALPEVLVITPRVFGDDRGFFFESWNARTFAAAGVDAAFVQDNHSRSSRGVLRGLHYQIEHAQGKLVRAVTGEVFDVVVDLRKSSPNFGRWVGVTLSADNNKMMWIPAGFAHGFLTMSETADFLYKTTDYWYPQHERTLLWNDPALGIEWPLDVAPKVAPKDATGTALANGRPLSMKPTVLLTGGEGQLGFELAQVLRPLGTLVATDRRSLDLADADAIVAAVRGAKPQLIVNAAAYTAVDLAETDSVTANLVNARAPGILAVEAKRIGAVLIHYSTDYVFDGMRNTPYEEDAPTNPLNVYGAGKLAGEREIAAADAHALVFRTSWIYGLRGKNFLMTIRRLAAERDELRIVADQVGVPNWSRTLAEATARVVAGGLGPLAERAGLYHMSSTGRGSWYDFARAIVGDVPRPRVIPITTAEYPTPAKRPAYAVLAGAKFERAFGFSLPDWRKALADCTTGVTATLTA